jgi:hypothetical protein
MSKSTITMSDEAHALAVYASIAGRTTSTELLSKDRDGEEVTTERKTQEIVANAEQYEKAKSLVGKLRAALGRHATNVEPLGYLTDPARLAEFKVTVAAVEAEIEAHNAILDQCHPIRHDVLILPIGRVLDEKSQRRLCATVTEELTTAKLMLQNGDVKNLGAWLQHRKNLASLMPSIVGRVVDSAIEQITDQRKKVAKLIKAGLTVEKAAAEIEVDQINDALAWVETSLTGVKSDNGTAQSVQ